MKRLISAAIAALFMLLVFHVVQAPQAEAQVCPGSQNFVVGGTGDPNGAYVPNVPAGPRTNIIYPASISPVGGYVSADESIRIGTEGLTNALNSFRARCPGSGVTIIGYSLGAIVVSDVCDRLDGRNTTCITEGNPKRQPGAEGSGITGILPTFIPGFVFTGWRAAPAGGPAIVEICNLRDLYCSAINPLKDPLTFAERAIGTYCQQQHSYPAPCAEPVFPSYPVPWDVPNPRDLDPVTRQLVPHAPIRTLDAPYVPTRLGDFLPPVLDAALPTEVTGYVPPPVPDWAVASWNDIVAAVLNALPAAADVPSAVPDVVPAVATEVPAQVPDVGVSDVAVPDVAVADVSPPVSDPAPPAVDAAEPAVADVAPPVSDAVTPVAEAAIAVVNAVVEDVGSAVGDVLSAVNDAVSMAVADLVPPAIGDVMPNIQGLP